MITVKCTYANGTIITTRINATLEEAKLYYVGNYFNLGSESDNMQQCVKVEQVAMNIMQVNIAAWGDWDAMIDYVRTMHNAGFTIDLINSSELFRIMHGEELEELGFAAKQSITN
jgi:hypothetical protein